MRLHLTGCSGGKSAGLRTTTLLPGRNALIDAGVGVRALDIEGIARIDYAVVKHSHLDHMASLPSMASTAGESRARQIFAHSLPEAIDSRRSHLINLKLWPDFSEIPDAKRRGMRYAPFTLGESITLDHRRPGMGKPCGVYSGLLAKELAKLARSAKI